MAFRSSATALAIKVQSAVDVAATIATPADLISCYDLRPSVETYTLANPEYTGTVDRPGDFVLGRGRSITFNVVLRGPGGAAPPAADAFVLGRILRAARFAELTQATPLLASGAITAGTTTSGILPVGASGVDDFYNGLPAILSDQGAGVRGLTMVRDYVGASRLATFMETFGSAPAANVTIPAFLAYRYNASAPDVYLSADFWLDKKRYKMLNGVVSGLQFNFPVSNRGDTAVTYLAVTLTGDVASTGSEIDENAPVVPSQGGIPPFRDGDAWLANKSVCGSSFTADMGIRVAYPPCPGKPTGAEAPQIVETRRSASMTLNETLLSASDFNALADAQNYQGLWLQYGNTTGKTVSFGITDGRLGYSEADPSGEFVTRSPEMYIDGAEKAVSLVFPYY